MTQQYDAVNDATKARWPPAHSRVVSPKLLPLSFAWCVTKRERVLTLLSRPRRSQHRGDDAGDRLAATQRAWFPGRHGEEKAWFLADCFKSGGRRSPLPHRNAARSLTWTKRQSMSQGPSRG